MQSTERSFRHGVSTVITSVADVVIVPSAPLQAHHAATTAPTPSLLAAPLEPAAVFPTSLTCPLLWLSFPWQL